ncbi:3-octaprenyl-4hydroxybenzoate decarboxylase [Sulfuricurvum kujiense DSM 16994]|uniref:3-octaprenyl-4hydroxybenzoate decarboxylase n=1 Tax=Sulfuricurvum kujiense (strain ATCC BAA-921 / DSM 16994 / JCM 11577 / YK-1) TaxID=709032 RepID=E4U290_SULKY|nr:menaquinone biosynthesis decarboxylase [Sulfuricurvum kujiense]ADR33540.1 3-octaprenyl-4hydroxybenzoate decarboxylase [Sulfuricurvum kujiense DSM 16994]
MTLTKTIDLLNEKGELRIIDTPLDINLEIPHLAYAEVKKENGGKALLFTHPVDKATGKNFDIPVVMNLFGSYRRTELLFGRKVEGVASEIEKLLHMKPPQGFKEKIGMLGDLFAMKDIFPKKLKIRGSCQEIVKQGDDVNLYDLPVLTTWEEDGGPFITMGQVYTQSLDGALVNLGMYRLQVYDKNHLGMHWQIHKDSSHFFDQYQREGKKMPVTIAIGGDPLYTWCATAPLPYGVNELLLYGLIKKESPKLVESLTTPLFIPEDVDFVIEGWVDTAKLRVEGPFGDHTGYYTLKEFYPELEVSAITHRKNPYYLATVVGKPPLEDKYMGWATERVFLPLLKTNAADLIDYHMPENGVFHNLILGKMKPLYKGHAKQFMHIFWGSGQMSFVKHALFFGEDAPKLTNYEALVTYALNRFLPKCLFISEGITDALDHSSPESLVGGKLGIDFTASYSPIAPESIDSSVLLEQLRASIPEITGATQYMRHTANPITVISVNKKRSLQECFGALEAFTSVLRIVVFVDEEKNDIHNPYMLIWRVTNNMDAARDVYRSESIVAIDGTTKTEVDGFEREWPGDVECTPSVVERLKALSLWDLDPKLEKKYQL